MNTMNSFFRTYIIVFLVSLTLASTSVQAALTNLGNGMVYDGTLDITWLQDANYADTSGYDDSLYGIDTGGAMTWADATVWASNLVFGGYSDWRLSDVTPTVNELASVFNDFTASANDPFINHTPKKFITGSTLTANGQAHAFETKFGGIFTTSTTQKYQAWAVRDGGSVSAVPIPAAFWLFFSGLVGLIAMAKRK